MVRIQFYSFSKFHWLGFKNTKPVYRWRCDHKNVNGSHKGKMAKAIKKYPSEFFKEWHLKQQPFCSIFKSNFAH